MIALGSDDERDALEEVHHVAELALQLLEGQRLVVGYQTARARLLAKRMADSIRGTAPLVADLLRSRANAHADAETAALNGKPWQCYAKPASLGGKTCGHANEQGGERFDGMICCAGCGATKFASDARRERGRESGGEA